MIVRDVVRKYYEFANAGAWDKWCDLFAEDAVVDEQLAGHVEGREVLRSMMAGFPAMYSSFANHRRHVVVEGDQAAVLSHIHATTPGGTVVEVDVMNYFRVRAGRIAYMTNVHDTVPFVAAGVGA